MKIRWKALLICIIIPISISLIVGFLTADSVDIFNAFDKPFFAPPSWLFPIVWPILYTLMGISSYLIYTSAAEAKPKKIALCFYGAQLFINFFWSFFFFSLGLYAFAFIWLILLWIFVVLTIRVMYPISKPAAFLLLPYLAWLTFAGYLNVAIDLYN